MTLADARAGLTEAMRAELPSFVTIPDHPIAPGKWSRIAAAFYVDEVLPAIDDEIDMYTAELRLEIPSTPSTPGAWQMLDDLVDRVDAAMPIQWLALDDWAVSTEASDAVTILRATCTAIGHRIDAAPTEPERILIGDGPGLIKIGDGEGVLRWR